MSYPRRNLVGMTPIALAAKQAVDTALGAGKIAAARRNEFLMSYLIDPTGTQALLDALVEPSPAVRAAMTGTTPTDALLATLWPSPAPRMVESGDPAYDALYGAPR